LTSFFSLAKIRIVIFQISLKEKNMSSYETDRGFSGLAPSNNITEKMNEMMEPGQIVRLRHNNVIEYVMTKIAEVSENDFKLIFSDRMLMANILDGHTASINYINQLNEECIISGVLEKATAEFPQLITLRPTKIEKYKDARKTRRYSLNHCCNIFDEDKQHFGIVKNISFAGLRLFTKGLIEDRKNVKLQLFIEPDRVINLDIGMVRNKQFYNHNDYGFVILESKEEERQKLRELVRVLEMQESQ
jgi:hypothetical protein